MARRSDSRSAMYFRSSANAEAAAAGPATKPSVASSERTSAREPRSESGDEDSPRRIFPDGSTMRRSALTVFSRAVRAAKPPDLGLMSALRGTLGIGSQSGRGQTKHRAGLGDEGVGVKRLGHV